MGVTFYHIVVVESKRTAHWNWTLIDKGFQIKSPQGCQRILPPRYREP